MTWVSQSGINEEENEVFIMKSEWDLGFGN